jgi:hypothetical protein
MDIRFWPGKPVVQGTGRFISRQLKTFKGKRSILDNTDIRKGKYLKPPGIREQTGTKGK